MTESKLSKSTRELKEAEKWLKYVEAFDKGGNFIIEEGLWIGMGVDIFFVLGEVHYKENPILFKQRDGLVDLFGVFDALATKGIPILENINPFGLINNFISPLAILIMKNEREPCFEMIKKTKKIKNPKYVKPGKGLQPGGRISEPEPEFIYVETEEEERVPCVDPVPVHTEEFTDFVERMILWLAVPGVMAANEAVKDKRRNWNLNPKYYYVAVPMVYRTTISMMIPAMTRMVFKFLSNKMSQGVF